MILRGKIGMYSLAIGIVLLCVVLIVFVSDGKSPQESSRMFPTDVLVRNVSWGSEALENIPFKKGDELEYTYIFGSGRDFLVSIDPSRLLERLDVTGVYVNEKASDIQSLSGIPMDTGLVVKIKGKAKRVRASGESPVDFLQANQMRATKEAENSKNDNKNFHKPSVRIQKTSYNSGVGNIIEIVGENIDSIDRIMIGERAFAGVIREGRMYVSVEKNTFDTGDYFVGLYLKSGILLPLEEKLSFIMNKDSIQIFAITPTRISNDEDRYVIFQGIGFDKLISIQLSNGTIFNNPVFSVINDQVLSIRVPKSVAPGTYSINLMDTKGIYNSTSSLTITNP